MDNTQLEALVDRVGLSGVVESLERIARDKADHLRTAWQDGASAKNYEAAASLIATLEWRLQRRGL